MGTATMPDNRQPQKAMTHSGRFSLKKMTLSLRTRPCEASRAANPRAARPTSSYVYVRLRNPSSYTMNSPRARARSSKKSISVSRRTSDLLYVVSAFRRTGELRNEIEGEAEDQIYGQQLEPFYPVAFAVEHYHVCGHNREGDRR